MNDSFNEFLSVAGSYAEHEKSLLEKELTLVDFKKGDVILHEGAVCSSVYFIIIGSVYQLRVDSDLKENIVDLNVKHDWVINPTSFTAQCPSGYEIKAYEDVIMYRLSLEAIHRLIAQSQSFLQLGKVLGQSISRLGLFDNDHSPDEKYLYILKSKPQLLQKFTQRMIASYLKITPETLSRVRNRFSKK